MNRIKAHRFFPEDFITARLISRPNRFVVRLSIDEKEYGASLPNPGKLGELFIPGAVLYVQTMGDHVKYPYRVIAVESAAGEVVMLDTHTNNRVAEYLFDSRSIKSFKDYHVKKREVTVGHSRFDFLLENEEGDELFCEVKSCTLFGGELAMFPDAVTSRGKRHIEELAEMSDRGIKTAVLFVIQSVRISGFSPDYHTDPDFSETLYRCRDKVKIIAVTAGWDRGLNLIDEHRELPLLWDLYEKEGVGDSGLYIMQFYCDQGVNGRFKDGYYLYVSYEDEQLSRRVERHKRKRKKTTNLRDELREAASLEMTWTIRTADDERKDFISSISHYSDESIGITAEYGLLYFSHNPRLTREFQDLLLEFRMEKPFKKHYQ